MTETFEAAILRAAREELADEPDALARLTENADEKVVATMVQDCTRTLVVDAGISIEQMAEDSSEVTEAIGAQVIEALVARARIPR